MLDFENEIMTFIEKNMTGTRYTRRERKNREISLNAENNAKNKENSANTENNEKNKEHSANTENNENSANTENNENSTNTEENANVCVAENEKEGNDVPMETSEDNTQNETDKEIESGDNLDKTIEEPKSTESMDKVEPAQLSTPKTQQYFVKVLGQPSLPNRADAYKFFSSLNAATIKKHKVIQNLLVVGFDNEQDYEKAVAASDTVVGNCKLIIKTNDKQVLSTTTTPCKDKTESEKSEAMLSPDLENQITDLLSTIKQEQTDSTENTESSNAEKNAEQIDAAKDDNTPSDKEANGVNSVVENTDSLTKEDDESNNLDTIQEVDESDIEPKTNVANVKNDTGKSTPMKKRQSVATPRTIRTRRSSKLEQQND
ncbi:hypothetical protein RR46_01808 [Papilio xuthus]|uniref:Uncharacterized protein n=1 Tax=Papilio xuthus TaxID=66420 RepID=A0A194QIW2_PAPXU|nr:hypothetical protein RR46_01808 [Papilio xuthus]